MSELLEKVRKAVAYADNGDPIKDALDDDEIVDALRLLLSMADWKERALNAERRLQVYSSRASQAETQVEQK